MLLLSQNNRSGNVTLVACTAVVAIIPS